MTPDQLSRLITVEPWDLWVQLSHQIKMPYPLYRETSNRIMWAVQNVLGRAREQIIPPGSNR